MSEVLTNITTRAKAIRKAHPAKAWTDCIKQASAELRGKAPAKKVGKAKPAVSARKVKTVIRTRKGGGVTLKIGRPATKRQIAVTHERDIQQSLQKKGLKMPHGYSVEPRSMISGLAGVSMARLDSELAHKQHLELNIADLEASKKVKGATAEMRQMATRQLAKLKKMLATSKQHITALKRSI